MTIYCKKCKSHHEMKDVSYHQAKNGRYYELGKCDKCGTKNSKFISIEEARGKGLLGNLIGKKIPVLGDIPLLNMLF